MVHSLFSMLLNVNKINASGRHNNDTLLASTTDGNDDAAMKYSQPEDRRRAHRMVLEAIEERKTMLLHSASRNSKPARDFFFF